MRIFYILYVFILGSRSKIDPNAMFYVRNVATMSIETLATGDHLNFSICFEWILNAKNGSE